MKKIRICIIAILLVLLAAFSFAACDGGGGNDNQPKQITVNVSQSGDTDGIIEFSVKAEHGNKSDDLILGDNTVTYTTTPYITVTFKLEDAFYSQILKINGEKVSVVWSDGTARYSFVSTDDATIELYADSNRHKVNIVIEDNTGGLATIDLRYRDEIKNSNFELNSNESFDLRRLTTSSNEDYRFITTIDCQAFGGYKSNSEGLSVESPWITISLREEDEGTVTVRVDVEYMVRVDLGALPQSLIPSVKIIQIVSSDVPGGVLLPKDMLEYGTVISENNSQHMTMLSKYVAKDALLAVVADDGQGNLEFFPRMLVNGTSVNSGLYSVTSAIAMEIGSI